MSNIPILEVASSGSSVNGAATSMLGAGVAIEVQADSYGTNGKVVLKARSAYDGSVFKTLTDPNTVSGLAEYSADAVVYLDRLGQGWEIRADLVITTGTATNVLAIMSTN